MVIFRAVSSLVTLSGGWLSLCCKFVYQRGILTIHVTTMPVGSPRIPFFYDFALDGKQTAAKITYQVSFIDVDATTQLIAQ